MIVFLGATYYDSIIRAWSRKNSEDAQIYESPGGNAPNAAITASALGGDVALVSALGSDEPGEAIRTAWKMYPRLQTSIFHLHETPRSVIIEKESESEIFSNSPQMRFAPDAAAKKILQTASFVDFYPGLFRGKEDLWYELFSGLPRACSLREASREIAAGRTWNVLLDSARVCQRPDAEQIRALRAELVVLTDGPRGGEFWTHQGWQSFRPRRVDEVDSVGAGDAFRGALIWGLGQGHEPERAIEMAAEMGAQAAARRGGFPRSLSLGLDA